MYGCSGETDRRTDGRSTQSATGSDEAAGRRPARLILNIDHVYSTQSDSLVITISTTGLHGPLASSIVPDRRGTALRLATASPCPVPYRPSVRLASWSVVLCQRLTLYRCGGRWLVCNFIKWVSFVRSLVRRRRRVEFDESLKLTDAPLRRRCLSVRQPAIVSLGQPANRVVPFALIKRRHCGEYGGVFL